MVGPLLVIFSFLLAPMAQGRVLEKDSWHNGERPEVIANEAQEKGPHESVRMPSQQDEVEASLELWEYNPQEMDLDERE